MGQLACSLWGDCYFAFNQGCPSSRWSVFFVQGRSTLQHQSTIGNIIRSPHLPCIFDIDGGYQFVVWTPSSKRQTRSSKSIVASGPTKHVTLSQAALSPDHTTFTHHHRDHCTHHLPSTSIFDSVMFAITITIAQHNQSATANADIITTIAIFDTIATSAAMSNIIAHIQGGTRRLLQQLS